MKNHLLELVKGRVKYWWLSLIVGVIAIILGIWSIVTPETTLITLSYIFILAFVISGIFEIIFSVANKNILNGWGWSLASGIIELLLGLLLLMLPLPIVTTMFVYLIGFWIMFRSIWTIGEAVEIQQMGVKNWGWLLAIGIISVIFSFIFLVSPMIFKGTFIIAFASIAFTLYGIYRILLSFRLRSIYKDVKKIEEYL
ncbi:MAG: DUF308 domain-containing protein [Bacteroidales bacterium]|jgi:uncharacterized membrane protein HdeD (DUF308 family)|nr:DUF308 domain-containing protein [Bacteroidales bacterium]